MEFLGDYSPSVRRAFNEIDGFWTRYPGLVVCGTHNPTNWDMIIDKIRDARVTGLPYYGECYGHQLAAIEYARNVMGIHNATSEEFGVEGTPVVKKRQELNVGLKNGQSYWNNYEVDLLGWHNPPNFFTAQYHASYQSSLKEPHPLIKDFLLYAKSASRS